MKTVSIVLISLASLAWAEDYPTITNSAKDAEEATRERGSGLVFTEEGEKRFNEMQEHLKQSILEERINRIERRARGASSFYPFN